MENQSSSLRRPIPIRVECYAGYRGEQTPQKFFLRDQLIEIVDIVDRWLGPDHRYFKVQCHVRDLYILRFDLLAQAWELTLFAKEDYWLGRQTSTGPVFETGRDL